MTTRAVLPPILLVDDDPNDRLFVLDALASGRIANPIIECTNAQEARLEIARLHTRPVLCVLDIHFGARESGLEWLAWVREQPELWAGTPTIIVSGSDTERHRDTATVLEAVAYLRKPPTAETLLEAVRSLGVRVVFSAATGRPEFHIV